MGRKTVFVASPIGDEGSAERTHADELLNYFIEPAFEIYDFLVVRADKIPRATQITDDILGYLRSAEICIFDLTNGNPNVYYEFGVRHQTAQPFVLVAKEGQDLPFDLSGLRTVFYDLSTNAGTRDAIRRLRAFVEDIERSGYVRDDASVSLATVMGAITRIERRLNTQSGPRQVPTQPLADPAQNAPIGFARFLQSREDILPVSRRMARAIHSGDVEKAAELLPALVEEHGCSPECLVPSVLLATAGYEVGAETSFDLLEADDLSRLLPHKDIFPEMFSAAVSFYYESDREAEVIDRATGIANKLLPLFDDSPQRAAILWNQLQRLHNGLQAFAEAAECGRKAVGLAPDDFSFAANLIENLLELREYTEAEPFVDRLLSGEAEPPPRFIRLAVEVLLRNDRAADALPLYESLVRADPDAALSLALDDELGEVLGVSAEEVVREIFGIQRRDRPESN